MFTHCPGHQFFARLETFAEGQHNSDRAIGVLGEIAMSSRPIPLRRAAIASISSKPGEPAVDWLFKIYDADQNLEIRKAVVSGFSRRKSERAGKKLLEIAQSSENVELRKAAISAIARRSGDQAIEIILALYATEKDPELPRGLSARRWETTRQVRLPLEKRRSQSCCSVSTSSALERSSKMSNSAGRASIRAAAARDCEVIVRKAPTKARQAGSSTARSMASARA